MTVIRFASIVSILVGGSFFYAGINGILTARWIVLNGLLGGMIFGGTLMLLVLGLAMILPDRTFRRIRQLAEQTTAGPIRFLFALPMLVCLPAMKLAGGFSLWVSVLLCAGYVLVYIFPGLVFRDLTIAPCEEVSLIDHRAAVIAEHSKGSILRRSGVVALSGFFFVGLLGLLLGPQTIPSPNWASFSGKAAILGGVVFTWLVFHPMFRTVPRTARARTFPGIALVSAVCLLVSVAAYRSVLLEIVPTVAASVLGEEVSPEVIVIKSMPDTDRNGCRGSVKIRTAAGDREVCNLSIEFLEALSPGDTVIVTGKATGLGQSPKTMELVR